MVRFRFKFAALETVRRTREDECLRLLARAQSAFRDATEQKQGLLAALDISLRRRELLGIEPVGPNVFGLECDFITGTKQRIVQSDQAILRAKRGVEKALRAYLNARRQTRMIEMLREKDYAEYRKQLAKREQKELDELYVMRARLMRESA